MNSEDLNVGSTLESMWCLKATKETVAVSHGHPVAL